MLEIRHEHGCYRVFDGKDHLGNLFTREDAELFVQAKEWKKKFDERGPGGLLLGFDNALTRKGFSYSINKPAVEEVKPDMILDK